MKLQSGAVFGNRVRPSNRCIFIPKVTQKLNTSDAPRQPARAAPEGPYPACSDPSQRAMQVSEFAFFCLNTVTYIRYSKTGPHPISLMCMSDKCKYANRDACRFTDRCCSSATVCRRFTSVQRGLSRPGAAHVCPGTTRCGRSRRRFYPASWRRTVE